MRTTGVRELKNSLSEYLRMVLDGETVLVTDHGTVVAQLTAPPQHVGRIGESEEEAIARLGRTGKLRMAKGEPRSATADPLPKPHGKIDLAAALRATRADRNLP